MNGSIRYKCLSCDYEFTGSNKKTDGTSCPICLGPIVPLGPNNKNMENGKPGLSNRNKALTITVSVKDTDIFKSMYRIMDYLYMKVDEETRQQAIKMMAKAGIIQIDNQEVR